jgi:hypothetical protein
MHPAVKFVPQMSWRGEREQGLLGAKHAIILKLNLPLLVEALNNVS